MAARFLDLAFTPDVKAAQARYYGRSQVLPPAHGQDRLGADEAAFIAEMDSFYLASVNQEGWPYLQHRGGPKGFLKVLGPTELGFADFKGNRQLLTTGNLSRDGRVCLFLMSYPLQTRLKVLGRAQVLSAKEDPDLARILVPPGLEGATERLFRIQVEGFDWNCPKYITPRFTEAEVTEAIRPLQARIAELEADLARVSRGKQAGPRKAGEREK
jgi:predicted pyridoxine 5'-phosphate oxidase superfamily flavin-nucleotide-binding protein